MNNREQTSHDLEAKLRGSIISKMTNNDNSELTMIIMT